MLQSFAADCFCDACAQAGVRTIGTEFSCTEGCDYDLCADCGGSALGGGYRHGAIGHSSIDNIGQLALVPAGQRTPGTSVRRQAMATPINSVGSSPRSRTRTVLTPDPRAAGWAQPQEGLAQLSRPRGARVAPDEYRVVCESLRLDPRIAHQRCMEESHTRLDKLPWLLKWSGALQEKARRLALARLGGAGGLAALVLDLAPLPPPTALQPPPKAELGGGLAMLFAFLLEHIFRPLSNSVAVLQVYGPVYGLYYTLRAEGVALLVFALYGAWNSSFDAQLVSVWLLVGRMLLSAPTFLWHMLWSDAKPGETAIPPWQQERSVAEEGGTAALVRAAGRARELLDVGAVRSAALALKDVSETLLANPYRCQPQTHEALCNELRASWDAVLMAKSPGLSPAELRTVASWLRAWVNAVHPVLEWQHQRVLAQQQQQHGSRLIDSRWASAYWLVAQQSIATSTVETAPCLVCGPSMGAEAVEQLAIERSRSVDRSSWALAATPRVSQQRLHETSGAELSTENIRAAIADALRALEWVDLEAAALVTAVDDATLPALSRKTFDGALLALGGLCATFGEQEERPASFRFYDLGAVAAAFGEAAVLREKDIVGGGRRRRWIQQLLVERRPVPRVDAERLIGKACPPGLVLTVWPCEAVWREESAQWAMFERPSYAVTMLA